MINMIFYENGDVYIIEEGEMFADTVVEEDKTRLNWTTYTHLFFFKL